MKKISRLNRLGLVGLITLNSSCYTLHSGAGIDSGSGVVAPVAINLATGLISHIIAEQRARKLEEKIEDIEESTRKQNETQIVTSGGINPLIEMHYDTNNEYIVFSAGTKTINNDFDPKTREIYIMRIDRSGGLRQLTNDNSFDGYPRFVGKNRDKIMWLKGTQTSSFTFPESIDEISSTPDKYTKAKVIAGLQNPTLCLKTPEARSWLHSLSKDQLTILGLSSPDLNFLTINTMKTDVLIKVANTYKWTVWKSGNKENEYPYKDAQIISYDPSDGTFSIMRYINAKVGRQVTQEIKRNGSGAYEDLIKKQELAAKN